MMLTGVPAARFSRLQHRCARSMRYIVAHMQTTGERKWISCSGCSCFRRVDQVQLGADRPLGARRGLLDLANDLAGRAADVGLVDDFHRALGMHQDLDARIFCAERIDVLRPEHLVDAAVALPEQHLGVSRTLGAVLPPNSLGVRIPDGHLLERNAHRLGRVAAQGADRERTARGCVRSNAHSSTAAALLDVQTMPPCRPQKAFRLAAELM